METDRQEKIRKKTGKNRNDDQKGEQIMISLDILPNDVLIEIFLYLKDSKILTTVIFTCKLFYNIVIVNEYIFKQMYKRTYNEEEEEEDDEKIVWKDKYYEKKIEKKREKVLKELKKGNYRQGDLRKFVMRIISKNDDVVKSLGNKIKYPRPEKRELHCVRCHENYDPRFNTIGSCKIEHNYDEVERLWKGSGGSEWELSCCGQTERTSSYDTCEDIDWGFCFEGYHTENPNDVDYDENTMITCEDNGCQKNKVNYTKKKDSSDSESSSSSSSDSDSDNNNIRVTVDENQNQVIIID